MTSSESNVLAFDSVEGRLYAVDATEDLHDEDWQELVKDLEGTGHPIEWIDLDDSAIRFYRVRVEIL